MPDPKIDSGKKAPPAAPARGYGPDPDFLEEAKEAASAEAEAAEEKRGTPPQQPQTPVENVSKRNLEP